MNRKLGTPHERMDEVCDFFGINKEEAHKCNSITITIDPGEFISVQLNMPATFEEKEV